MGDLYNAFSGWVRRHPYQSLGIFTGFAASLLIILIGVWNTLFILCMVGIGLLFGRSIDEGSGLQGILDRIRSIFSGGKKQ